MKKGITIFLITLVAVSALVITFMVKTDRILLRAPVLFQEKPLVTYIVGKAEFRQLKDEPWRELLVGTRLKQGAEIKTGPRSLVDIRLHRSTAMRVAAESNIRIDYLSIRKLLIKIDSGSIFGKFKKLFDLHSIRFNTPTSTASIRGTELAIEVKDVPADEEDKTAKKKKKKETSAEAVTAKTELQTTIYGLTGIIEVFKPAFREQTVLLANRKKLKIKGSNPPENPENMNEDEIQKVQSVLNSLHYYEVLLISQKIHFRTGSASILKGSYKELDRIAKILLERDEKILIEGHTDSVGAAYQNQTLSLNRARAIQKYLVSKGVEQDMLKVAGYGESKPVASNKNRRGRALNRRVEFVVLDE